MKKIITGMIAMIMAASVFAQTVEIEESAAWVHTQNVTTVDGSNHTCYFKGFTDKTAVSFNYKDYADVNATVYLGKDYVQVNADAEGNYNLSDTLAVFAGMKYNFENYTVDVKSATYNNLVAYAGASATGSWKMFTMKGSASVGYDIVDTDKTTWKDNEYSVNDRNQMYVNLRADISVFEYINFYAGIESYQHPCDSTISFTPTSVNNYIGLNAYYPITNHLTVTGNIYHNCRHPETPALNDATDTKENVNTIASIGMKIVF